MSGGQFLTLREAELADCWWSQVGDLPPPADGPNLLSLREVRSLFNAAGGALQHLLNQQEEGLASPENMEIDAALLPNFMEQWAMDPSTLQSFGGHWETGEVIPEELLQAMQASQAKYGAVDLFQKAQLDLELHSQDLSEDGIMEVARARLASEEIASVLPDFNDAVEEGLCNFHGPFSTGFAAGEYVRIWKEVLVADLFEVFQNQDGDVSKLGKRMRELFLAPGADVSPTALIRELRGRGPKGEAAKAHPVVQPHPVHRSMPQLLGEAMKHRRHRRLAQIQMAASSSPTSPTSPQSEARARGKLLQLAKVAEEKRSQQTFAVLCVDEGTWPQDVMKVDAGCALKLMSRCKGVTRACLKMDLDAEALRSIRDCFERLLAVSESIIGVTADLGNLWLKHHSAIRQVITERPVYLTPIVQLPMISASFKSREQTLLVTWGSQEEVEMLKPTFCSGCNIVMDLDRLEILGVDVSQDARWTRYLNFDTNTDEDMALGSGLLQMVKDRISEVNVQGKKDMLIKSLIVTTRLSMFSNLLREGTGLPVFNELTMLNLFSSASALSHFNDAKVLCRLSDKLERSPAKSPRVSPGGCKLGLLQLEYEYPPAFGDVDHPGTFGFKTCPRIVKGLTFEKAQEGSFDQTILEEMSREIRNLEEEGVVGITGNCGFMMYYQCFARHIAQVPVFMSALIQAATMAAAMEPAERVLILTANAATLQPGKDKLLLESGIQVTNSEKFLIRGCEKLAGFDAVANAERVDTIRVQNAISNYVLEILKEENSRQDYGAIKMVLLECTELPHYADELRRITSLPVFDAVTCVNYFFHATATQNWNNKTFSPHNPSFWASNFDAEGHPKDSKRCAANCDS